MFVNHLPYNIATTPVDIFLVQETEINGDRPNDLNQNTDELFDRIFNRPRPTGLQRIIVPLFINDQPQGEIVVFVALGNGDNLEIVATTLLSRIREYVRPDVQEALEQLVGDSDNLTINGHPVHRH